MEEEGERVMGYIQACCCPLETGERGHGGRGVQIWLAVVGCVPKIQTSFLLRRMACVPTSFSSAHVALIDETTGEGSWHSLLYARVCVEGGGEG